LREGLDLPEVALVAIFDADKEGFLRSERSLVQTIGRAARNVEGHVILYADRITRSMDAAMQETQRRREKQQAYNTEHQIQPKTVQSDIKDILNAVCDMDYAHIPEVEEAAPLNAYDAALRMQELERLMSEAAADLRFEDATTYRDELLTLKEHGNHA